jgi:hypothetical protein
MATKNCIGTHASAWLKRVLGLIFALSVGHLYGDDPGTGGAGSGEKPPSAETKAQFSLDFTREADGPAAVRLEALGFQFKEGMDDPDEVSLQFRKGALWLEAKKPVFALAIRDKLDFPPGTLRLEWGVEEYPVGASYEKGVRNEALMVIVFFGTKRISSGNMFVPDSPYFIGFFLSPDDPLNKPFTGRTFAKGGRYLCVGNSAPGKATVTEIDLAKAFRECFGKTEVPNVSGMNFEMDTSYVKPGTSRAYVRNIDFLP